MSNNKHLTRSEANYISGNIDPSSYGRVYKKLENLILFLEPSLCSCRIEYKHNYVSDIRNRVIESMSEIVKYRYSAKVSHLYTIDDNLKTIARLVRLLNQLGDPISYDTVYKVAEMTDEMGRIIGGMTKNRNRREKEVLEKRKENKEKTSRENDSIVKELDILNKVQPAVIFDKSLIKVDIEK